MANVINKSTNKWSKGLVMDFSPENTTNEVLTHALNATLLTFNGNELSLQNDMGNARVETAFLPNGYIPVGTCEYGGIIYIVSYNPLEDKSQIGCFPSPERNISREELGEPDVKIENKDFLKEDIYGNISGEINNNSKYVLLKNDKLNPGDKFIVYANKEIYNERLEGLETKNNNSWLKEINPLLKLSIVSIEDSGKIIPLNSTVRLYENGDYKYHILGQTVKENGSKEIDVDSYRNILSSGYNIFKSKTSGKLAILAELVMIDSFSVTHSINQINPTTPDKGAEYEIIINTEYSSEKNDAKLQCYFLENSNGYIFDPPNEIDLYKNGVLNEDLNNYNLYGGYKLNTSLFKLPIPKTYGCDRRYYMFKKGYYYGVSRNQVIKFYKLGYLTRYVFVYYDGKYSKCELENEEGEDVTGILGVLLYYAKFLSDKVISDEEFEIDNKYNKFDNSNLLPDEKQITVILQTPELLELSLGTVKFPDNLIKDGYNFPFIYNYTIVPCMEYGKLDHLKISNTIDFSKINDFNSSKFNVWKYRIDNDQLRLTFGAEIYDVLSSKKVEGLFLEFYDHLGFAGSIEISNKKSYSGVFTKIINLGISDTIIKKQIIDGQCIESKYKRNINIIKKNEKYYYNTSEVERKSSSIGWGQKPIDSGGSGGTEGHEESGLSEEFVEVTKLTKNATIENVGNVGNIFPNDCGTLYPNMLYGVKAYFKIKHGNTVYYEEKEQFFLYTFPIYNDYYYSIDNFNELTNPELNFALTYKLNNLEGNLSYYENENLKSSSINEYRKFNYDQTYLQDTVYYKHTGLTWLNLLLSLLKDYENFGVLSDYELKDHFSCKLRFEKNKNDKSFYVDLNLINYELSKTEDNDIGFINTSKYELYFKNSLDNESKDILFSDFVFPNPINYIEIGYKFIVGYEIEITDIKRTEIPCTTICPLCHKLYNGEFNYEDFGIYQNEDNYFINAAICNGGSTDKSTISILRQTKSASSNDKPDTYFSYVDSFNQNAKTPLNLERVDELLPYIGKLTFCQPHVHSMNDYNGVNMYRNNGKYYISRYDSKFSEHTVEDNKETSLGCAPTNELYKNPIYNLSVNTYGFLIGKNKFISAILYGNTYTNTINIWLYSSKPNSSSDWEHKEYPLNYLRKFTGLNIEKINEFNKCLIQTMKDVYVYNPDYNSYFCNVGDVKINESKALFISNLICEESEMTFNDNDSLNNYIYFFNGLIKVSDYLNDLNEFSGINIKNENNFTKELINFVPNLQLCGTKELPVLLTTLTYNIPTPLNIYNDIDFKNKYPTIIKTNEDDIYIFNEVSEKNKLYYLLDQENPKLIQLDVKNYNIDENGVLKLNEDKLTEYKISNENIITMDKTTDYYYRPNNNDYHVKDEYSRSKLKYSSITLNDLIYMPNEKHRLFMNEDLYFIPRDTPYGSYLYYRNFSDNFRDRNKVTGGLEYSDKNRLYLYIGPCFESE